MLGGIGKVLKGVTGLLNGVSQLMKSLGGLMNSPFGSMLAMAFPPLGMASAFMSFSGMLGNLSNGVGGGQNY